MFVTGTRRVRGRNSVFSKVTKANSVYCWSMHVQLKYLLDKATEDASGMLDRHSQRVSGSPLAYVFPLRIYPEVMKCGAGRRGDEAVDASLDNEHLWPELIAGGGQVEWAGDDKVAIRYRDSSTHLPRCRELTIPNAGCLLVLDTALTRYQSRLALRCCTVHEWKKTFIPPALKPEDMPLIEALGRTILKDSWPLDEKGKRDLKCEIVVRWARDAARDGHGVVERFDRRHRAPEHIKRLAGAVVLCHVMARDPGPRKELRAVLVASSPNGRLLRLAEYCPRNRIYPFLMSHRGIPLVAAVNEEPVLHHQNPTLAMYLAEASYFIR